MIEIRWAASDDADDLAALNQQFNGVHRSAHDIRVELASPKRDEVVCVAAQDGRTVGFACAQHRQSVCYPEPVGEITEIYVEQPHHGQGIGRKMVAFLEAQRQEFGVEEVHVLTGRGNASAKRLWISAGYHLTDHLVYTKTFKTKGRGGEST